MIVTPKMLVLDTATIGKLAADYSSVQQHRRSQCREFLDRLTFSGVHVAFSFTHIMELLSHGDNEVTGKRFVFCSQLPLIAWVRPYVHNWFPAAHLDVVQHEFHARIRDGIKEWAEIAASVRGMIWETGFGGDLFVDNGDGLWDALKVKARASRERTKFIASIARTDPGSIFNEKVSALKSMPRHSKESRRKTLAPFIQQLAGQITEHGDKRLESAISAAASFAYDSFARVETLETDGVDLDELLFNPAHIPSGMMTDDLTVEEYGELTAISRKLEIVGQSLSPPSDLSLHNTPVDAVPSFALERQLASIQRKAQRVCGSDLGDGDLAVLAIYADFVELDKRTFEYMRQLRKRLPRIADLLGATFKVRHYTEIPTAIGC